MSYQHPILGLLLVSVQRNDHREPLEYESKLTMDRVENRKTVDVAVLYLKCLRFLPEDCRQSIETDISVNLFHTIYSGTPSRLCGLQQGDLSSTIALSAIVKTQNYLTC